MDNLANALGIPDDLDEVPSEDHPLDSFSLVWALGFGSVIRFC